MWYNVIQIPHANQLLNFSEWSDVLIFSMDMFYKF